MGRTLRRRGSAWVRRQVSWGNRREVMVMEVEEVESGDDDGVTYGSYRTWP